MTNRRLPHRSLILCCLLSSCVLPPTQAELQTYEVVAPAHAAYVSADQSLPPDAKQRRLDLLEAWRVRVGGKK